MGYEEPAYHLQKPPVMPDKLNTKFYLYTHNDTFEELSYMNEASFEKVALVAEFDVVYIVVHDYNEKDIRKHPDYVELKSRLFSSVTNPMGVLFVDWTRGASNEKQAKSNTMIVGREVGLISYYLEKYNIISGDYLEAVGLGMGAQVLHFAGRWYTEIMRNATDDHTAVRTLGLKKWWRIVALDPWGPDFEGYRDDIHVTDPHINRFDAAKVDVIHTASICDDVDGRHSELYENLGMSVSTGTYDFYPNGGILQPACVKPKKIFGLFDGEPKLDKLCNHRMALKYYIASIFTPTEAWKRRYLYAFQSNQFVWQDYQQYSTTLRKYGVALMGWQPGDRQALFDEKKRLHIPKADSGEIFLDFPDEKPTQTTKLDIKELPSCGLFRKPDTSNGRVVNGHLPYPGQFPFVVCLTDYHIEENHWAQACTASIIDKHWIITASHCWLISYRPSKFYPPFKPIYLTFGALDCQNPGKGNWRRVLYTATEVLNHPKFNKETLDYDVSLIRLKEPIDIPEVYDGGDVNTICWRTMVNFNDRSRDPVYLAAYGTKGFDIEDDERLTWYKTRRHDPNWADMRGGQVTKEDLDRWPGGTFLVRNADIGKLRASHSGDSGGPFVWYIKADTDNQPRANVSEYRAVILAVLSASIDTERMQIDDTNSELGPAFGIKLSLSKIYSWIEHHVSEQRSYPEVKGVAHPMFSTWHKPSYVARDYEPSVHFDASFEAVVIGNYEIP
ncbi:Pancreatic lipase-related protein 2 [Halotydeus destructor]|nr:Pancreatic lipase-related protein 2 [Halotydeus destructor]